MFTPVTLERYLHSHIPLSADLGARPVVVSLQEVVLEAPLAPNINHRASAFGGSLTALAILAAWSWLRVHVDKWPRVPTLVIQRESMDFLAPAEGAFRARCAAPAAAAVERFDRMLERYRRARLELQAEVLCEGRTVGRLNGEFVALLAPPPDFG
ncbi:MAG: YiiD C-terminal domain-containing protein [Opitutales bacterium]